MYLLDERILADGSHAKTFASLAGDKVRIEDDTGAVGELSIAALDKVMTRYARELDRGVGLTEPALELPNGYRLRRLRFHAAVDATGRDYLVWERPGEVPIAAIGTMITAALRYLVLRLADTPPQESEGGGT